MVPGALYTNLKTKRVAEIVGVNERYVEYRYLELEPKGRGLRKTKPNVACADREAFEKKFKAS
jgi:hypothetical protein